MVCLQPIRPGNKQSNLDSVLSLNMLRDTSRAAVILQCRGHFAHRAGGGSPVFVNWQIAAVPWVPWLAAKLLSVQLPGLGLPACFSVVAFSLAS